MSVVSSECVVGGNDPDTTYFSSVTLAKLVAMGFTSTQIREAGVALPGASQYQIVDYLLGIGSGAAVKRLNDKNSLVHGRMLEEAASRSFWKRQPAAFMTAFLRARVAYVLK